MYVCGRGEFGFINNIFKELDIVIYFGFIILIDYFLESEELGMVASSNLKYLEVELEILGFKVIFICVVSLRSALATQGLCGGNKK